MRPGLYYLAAVTSLITGVLVLTGTLKLHILTQAIYLFIMTAMFFAAGIERGGKK